MKPRLKRLIVVSIAILACLFWLTQLVFATTATWTAKSPLSTARVWASAAAFGGKIYVFGGLNNTTKLSSVERYDPTSNSWDARAAMPTARYGTSAVTLNGKIYVIGGVNSSNQILNIVEVYDPTANTWGAAASMPTARSRLAAAAGQDGKIYATGGSTSSTIGLTGYSSLVEVYNPLNDTWSTVPPMLTPRIGHAAAVSGGKIYIFGGYGQSPGYVARYLTTAEVFDPLTNAWSTIPSMKASRYGLAAVTTSTGLIYLIGGYNESSVPPTNNEEYIPSAGTSSYVAGLPSGQRGELAGVSIYNQGDTLYAMGGGNMSTPKNNLDSATLSNLPQITPTPAPGIYPPAAVIDLTAAPGCGSGSILLAWTAPGEPRSSPMKDFQVRYSTSAITNQAGWDSATPVSTGIPDPQSPGFRQSMTVTGLTPGTTYYFAIRARNATSQIALLSNSPSAQAPTGTAQKPWTVMIYAAGDNNLHSYIQQDISSIELAAHNTCLNFVLFWDGLVNGDSAYYHLKFDPSMTNWAAYTEGVDKWSQGEANMGDPARLSGFVQWAKTNYPAAHYTLVIRDHGGGLAGMEEDYLSNDYLTIPELDQAIHTITNSGANPLDLVFMDACLMGMLEDAYQFRGDIGIYVASEDVTWSSSRSNSHHDYFYAVSPTTTAPQLAQMIVNGYANWMDTRLTGLRYTMSSADMAALDALVTATNNLASSLDAGMAAYSTQIKAARRATTYYYYLSQIDLYDFADKIYTNITDSAIRANAQAVKTAVEAYVLEERHSTSLLNSHGVTIFFPEDSSSFYNASRYDFAVGATWTGLILDSERRLGPNAATWGQLLTHYIQTFPGGPDVSEPPLPVSPQITNNTFIPLVVK